MTLRNGRRITFAQDRLSADDIAWLKKNGGRPGGSGGGNEIPEVLPATYAKVDDRMGRAMAKLREGD